MKLHFFLPILVILVMATPVAAQTATDWNTYSFITPDKWHSFKDKDHIILSQSQNRNEGCAITIIAPQVSSGDLETDAKSVFGLMYPDWQFRFTGEKQYTLSKGYTAQGFEYFMMEAPVHKMRPDGFYYDYEDGVACVIGFNKQVVIVSARHNRLLSCYCFHHYENWGRFFNSFKITNQTAPKYTEEAVSKRIIGSWLAMGSGALTEYIFAANGNYQFIGAYSSASKTTRGSDDYLEIKTSSWKGDGSYTIRNDQLLFKRYNDKNAEQVRFRFDKVNHGGTGWKDRLYMLKVSSGDGKEYEVCYEKGK